MVEETKSNYRPEVSEKISCRLKLPGEDFQEAICQIGERKLEIIVGKGICISIPIIQIQTPFPPGIDGKGIEIIYWHDDVDRRTLYLEMDSPQFFDYQLSMALQKAEDDWEEHIAVERRYAGIWRRILAAFFDSLILGIAGLRFFNDSEIWDLFIALLYYVIFWTAAGRTPGKMIMGIKILRPNGKSIGFFRAVLRFIGYYIFIENLWPLGAAAIFWNHKRRGFHDMIAGTVVVLTRGREQSSAAQNGPVNDL